MLGRERLEAQELHKQAQFRQRLHPHSSPFLECAVTVYPFPCQSAGGPLCCSSPLGSWCCVCLLETNIRSRSMHGRPLALGDQCVAALNYAWLGAVFTLAMATLWRGGSERDRGRGWLLPAPCHALSPPLDEPWLMVPLCVPSRSSRYSATSGAFEVPAAGTVVIRGPGGAGNRVAAQWTTKCN